jgi:phospholipid/cholesterol/gamma-HCH transport system substrate-binding protein
LFDYTKTEIAVGSFLILGLGLLGYLSISIGGLSIVPERRYHVVARFSNVGDLKPRAPVKVAGVTVGQVEAVRMVDYLGEAELAIDQSVKLPKDTIASIATSGLLGEAHVALSPGGAEGDLAAGDRISHTEPAINVTDLLGRYAFGGGGKGDGKPSGAADGGAAPPSAKEAP